MKALVAVPRVEVLVAGAPLTASGALALRLIRVRQRLSLPACCELVFIDPAGPPVAGDSLLPGAALRIAVAGFEQPLFAGQVTAIEYDYGASNAREIRVLGHDLLHQLQKRQPVGAHVQVTLAELAQSMVADLGLTVSSDITGPLWQRLIQYRQSDFELLTEVAERCGMYFALQDSELHFFTLEGTGDSIPLLLGDTLLQACVAVNAETVCRTVTTEGWDPFLVVSRHGSADRPQVGREVAAAISTAAVGGAGKRILADETAQDDTQMDTLAQAELDRRVAAEVTLMGVAEGDTRLIPGVPVAVSGLAEPLCGRYVITAVTHTIDQRQGFISEIDTSPPPPQSRPRGVITTVGRVTQVDDPEGLGRVKVSLLTYSEVETDWLQVMQPGAGSGKGFVIVPDRGDRVLVSLLREDPAQGIVLGGLYGELPPPVAAIEADAVQRFAVVTAGGHRIQLDDHNKSVAVETSGGHLLEMSPGMVRIQANTGSKIVMVRDKVSLSANSDLTIEAPGKTVTIRGQYINFERA